MKPTDACSKSIGLHQYQREKYLRVDGMTAMLERVEPVSEENTNREDAIQSQILECSTRPDGASLG
jgi:hypothetical protein